MRFPIRSRALTNVACCAALFAGACSDSTAPKAPSGVTVVVQTPSSPKPYYSTPGDTSQAVTCNPVFTATGSGSGEADWIDAKIYWYFGPQRTVPDDSVTISGQDVSSAFGGAAVAANDTVKSTWSFEAGLPFSATMVFRYTRNDTDTSATASFTCGPPPEPGTAAPVIDVPTIDPATGDLQPGDTIRVTYHVVGGAGLWESRIVLTGACQYARQFPEAMQGSVTRTVSIVLPANCLLKSDVGSPDLGVTIVAMDPLGRVRNRSMGTGRWLVDARPPKVDPQPRDTAGMAQWFVGDTLRVRFNATDNHALAMLYWQEAISGMRDSIPATGLLDTATRVIVVPSAWLGSARLRYWARDAAGLTSDTVNFGITPTPVAPIVSRPTRTARIDGYVSDVAYDARRQELDLAEPGADRVVVFSLASMSIARTIAVPGNPASLDLTPGGDSLVVALRVDKVLAIIDLRDSTIAPTRLAVRTNAVEQQAPTSVRVMANDKALVAINGYADSSVVEIDLATGAQRELYDPGRDWGASTLRRSGDGRVLVLNDDCVQRYDLTTDTFSACGRNPNITAVPVTDATGATVAVGLRIYDASMNLERIVRGVWGSDAGWETPPVALSPDGATLYAVDGRRGVIRARTTDGVTLDAAPYAGASPSVVGVLPNGQTIFLIGQDSPTTSTITLMDLR